jgi:hypothetical protein
MFEEAQDSGFRKHATFAPASQKRLGFRLRSPHLFGEEPCPLRLQTVFSPLPFAHMTRGTVREWREKSEGSEIISVYFTHKITLTKWKTMT